MLSKLVAVDLESIDDSRHHPHRNAEPVMGDPVLLVLDVDEDRRSPGGQTSEAIHVHHGQGLQAFGNLGQLHLGIEENRDETRGLQVEVVGTVIETTEQLPLDFPIVFAINGAQF